MNVICSGAGIGDAICALYAIAGSEQKANFFTKHPKWFQDVIDITIHPYIEALGYQNLVDAYTEDRKNFNRYGKSFTRKAIYSKNIGVKAEPKQPKLKRYWSDTQSNTIVVAPYSAGWVKREWTKNNFVRLVKRLKHEGFNVVVIGSGEEDKFSDFDCTKMINQTPASVIDLLLSAKVVVGNDSGIAHLSGMYGVPTVVVMDEHIGFDHVYSHTYVINAKKTKVLVDITLDDVLGAIKS